MYPTDFTSLFPLFVLTTLSFPLLPPPPFSLLFSFLWWREWEKRKRLRRRSKKKEAALSGLHGIRSQRKNAEEVQMATYKFVWPGNLAQENTLQMTEKTRLIDELMRKNADSKAALQNAIEEKSMPCILAYHVTWRKFLGRKRWVLLLCILLCSNFSFLFFVSSLKINFFFFFFGVLLPSPLAIYWSWFTFSVLFICRYAYACSQRICACECAYSQGNVGRGRKGGREKRKTSRTEVWRGSYVRMLQNAHHVPVCLLDEEGLELGS